jgi:hypothetical protein
MEDRREHFMGKKTDKFLLMAAAGLLVARGVPAVPADNDVDARLDAALQAAQADQVLVLDDVDGDDDLGLY